METQTKTSSDIILNILLYNWVLWLKQLMSKCQSHFGEIGISIINEEHPLVLSPPTPDDKSPQGKLLYPLGADGDFTDRAFTLYNNALKRFYELSAIRKTEDTECYNYILARIHPASETAVRNHNFYPTFKRLPIGQRATAYLEILQELHAATDHATKHNRTIQYFSTAFESDINTSIELLTQRNNQFLEDFGSTKYPGERLVEVDKVHSFLLCKLIEGENYRNFKDQVFSNSSTLLDDPQELASAILSWDLLHRTTFTSDSPSQHGQSFMATTPAPSNKPIPNITKQPYKPTPTTQTYQGGNPSKPHCPNCFQQNQRIFNNHGVPGKPPCLSFPLPSNAPYPTPSNKPKASNKPLHPHVHSYLTQQYPALIPPTQPFVPQSSPTPFPLPIPTNPASPLYNPQPPYSSYLTQSPPLQQHLPSSYPAVLPYQHQASLIQNQFQHSPAYPYQQHQQPLENPIIPAASSFVSAVMENPQSPNVTTMLIALSDALSDPNNRH